jgi:hypothetical protein
MGFAELVSAVEGSQKCAQQQENLDQLKVTATVVQEFTVSYLWRCC